MKTPRCDHCHERFSLWDTRRSDARYCSDACRQAAYRARRHAAAEPIDASTIVGKWFTWYPPDIRELLLQRRWTAGEWSKWLATAIVEDKSGDAVHVRGGPNGWCRRQCPLERFKSEATPDDA